MQYIIYNKNKQFKINKLKLINKIMCEIKLKFVNGLNLL